MKRMNPVHIPGYSQGGTVVGGIAYFTANSYQERLSPDGKLDHVCKREDYPYVAAIDVETMELIATYPFADTYDSSPLVIRNRDGRWLVLAHEYAHARTVAMRQEDAAIEWISEANQPGGMFFGYAYYRKENGDTTVLASVKNGLHAMSLETGRDEWFFPLAGGVTPCVDQKGGTVYFQTKGMLLKIRAETGEIMKSVSVSQPSGCVCWNTVWADDAYGCHVVTYWYSPEPFGSAIRVFDEELNLVWESKRLPMSKKATLAYHGGLIYAGCGDHWQKEPYLQLQDGRWKTIRAYRIQDGRIEWELDLRGYGFSCIPNIIYCNGRIIAESQTNLSHLGHHLFTADAGTGSLLSHEYKETPANSCGVPLLTAGKLFSGDLVSDSVLITEIDTGHCTDWIGAFGNAQTNDMCAPDGALLALR